MSRVVDIKQNRGVNYAILDGGLHQMKYDGQLAGMQIPGLTHICKDGRNSPEILRAPVPGKKDAEPYTLCGSLCTTMDVLARDVHLSNLREGDILVFRETGAYSVSEGMATFLSRDLPSVWLLCANGQLIKARENIETYLFNCF